MPTDVLMPQMGESITEGTITKWLKRPGDSVERDEPLFEISTDKVDAEIPAPAAGTLKEIRIGEGATVGVNTIVAVIDGKSGAAQEETAPAKAEAPSAAAGGIELLMPQMGESITEGTLTRWLRKVGDSVQRDEPLFEISTDKVDAEIPSSASGVLTEIRVPEGKTVKVNSVVAIIGGPAELPNPVSAADKAVSAPASAPATAAGKPSVPIAPVVAVPSTRARSSPLVRRIAKENNVDLGKVPGTGLAGRITRDDILGYLAGAKSAPAAAKSAAAPLPGALVPMTRMRSIIAQRMVESRRTSPHVHTVIKVDMTRIARLRERERSRYEQRNGVRLTYMPFITRAVIASLQRHPIVNAVVEGDAIRYNRNINLGIAVALEWGLIVPVIRQAEERNFLGLARAIADVAERARGKRLAPDEVAGGTFTLTNSGVFGDLFGLPIINQPQSAILAIGALNKEAAVLTDKEGNDSIAIRSMQHFALGFDHRIVDGADAGRFMADFKAYLENWAEEIG